MASALALASTSVVVAVHRVSVQCDQFVVFAFAELAKVQESMQVWQELAWVWLPEFQCYGADPG